MTDDKTGAKYPLADYELTPQMAIVDANLVMNMPKSLTAFGGYDAVTHALKLTYPFLRTNTQTVKHYKR